MRQQAVRTDDVERMQAWAGQSAALSQNLPAGVLTRNLWDGAVQLLGSPWNSQEAV
jgi:nitronate monooxygenase